MSPRAPAVPRPAPPSDRSLDFVLRLNVAWAAWLLLAHLSLALEGPTPMRWLVASWTAINLPIALAATNGHRGALAFEIALAVLATGRWLPMVAVNTWMLVTDHPLYLDSPATILVVALYAMVFAVPGFVLTVLYLANWRAVRNRVSRQAT